MKPLAEYWRCVVCGLTLITYADVLDAEGFCIQAESRWMQARGLVDRGDVRFERVELHAAMMLALWDLYLDWDGRGTFTGYASEFLVKRGAIEWDRAQRGRNHPKPHAIAASLDAPISGDEQSREDFGDHYDAISAGDGGDRLGGATFEGPGSVRADSDAALRRAFAEGSRIAAARGRRGPVIDAGRRGEVGIGGALLSAEVDHGASVSA